MSKRVVDPSTEESRGGRRFRYFSDGPIEDLGPVNALPGENAGQQETKLAGSPTDQFQVSAEMRAIAEKSVEQARQAFDGFLGAAHRIVNTFGGQADTAGEGAKGIAERAMTFAQQDIAMSFEFAQKLVRARDVQEVLKLQAEYIKAQMQLFSPRN